MALCCKAPPGGQAALVASESTEVLCLSCCLYLKRPYGKGNKIKCFEAIEDTSKKTIHLFQRTKPKHMTVRQTE